MSGGFNYSMKEPCDECPFRIGSGFVWEALEAHASGIFYCHKACDLNEDSDPEDETHGTFQPRDPVNTPQCAGALIFLMKQGRPNQAMRMACAIGWFDPSRLNMDAPVVSKRSQCRPATAREKAMYKR